MEDDIPVEGQGARFPEGGGGGTANMTGWMALGCSHGHRAAKKVGAMSSTISLMRYRSCWCGGLPVARVLASRCSMVGRATLREAPTCCGAADREATGCSASGWESVAAGARSDQGVWRGLGGAAERHRAGWGKAPQLHHRAEPLLTMHPSTDSELMPAPAETCPTVSPTRKEQAHWNPSQQNVMSLWVHECRVLLTWDVVLAPVPVMLLRTA